MGAQFALDEVTREQRAALEALGAAFLAGERVEDCFERANEAVRELRGPASTLVVALIEDGTLHTFHAGDSQALVVGGRGRPAGTRFSASSFAAVRASRTPVAAVAVAVAAARHRRDAGSWQPGRHAVPGCGGQICGYRGPAA